MGDGSHFNTRSMAVACRPSACAVESKAQAGSSVAALGLLFFVCMLSMAPGIVQARPALDSEGIVGKLELPAAWRSQFWGSPGARSLRGLAPADVAKLVPTQSGLRFCRCPACDSDERDDTLAWSIEQPKILKCRRCGVTVPSDKYPARVNKEIPEETIEVLPGVVHRYPYHVVEEGKARYPDERLYFQAKIDYESKKYLSKFALYAAAESRGQAESQRDSGLSRLACTIMLRFAQVYPAYATHLDQPGRAKVLQPARLQPPFRNGYQTGKWEWNGSLEVPLNLVMAYALLRDDPAWAEAGKLLGDPRPDRSVELNLFRSAAEFARNQPEGFSEEALHVDRGMLAVGQLVGDRRLTGEALVRIEQFTRQGFYHDGFWREAQVASHRRVLGLLDGGVSGMLAADRESTRNRFAGSSGADSGEPEKDLITRLPMLELARAVSARLESRRPERDVQQASWPSTAAPRGRIGPVLLGGAGLAQLVVGQAEHSLGVEVRSLDSHHSPHFQSLALRVSVAGQSVLDDLDEGRETATGWERATASHNTVVVDGLNQRETPVMAGKPAAGGDFLYYAADPDFQVVAVSDPRAYPLSTTRYRQTVIVTVSERSRYALAVFEVHGGLQHDQIFHSAPGRENRWWLAAPREQPPASLLPSSIAFLPTARPDQGRWFVQSYGEFQLEGQAALGKPSLARLEPVVRDLGPVTGASAAVNRAGGLPSVQLHVLGDLPIEAFTALSPDPNRSDQAANARDQSGRAALILRRRSAQGETLDSTFVTLFEPVGDGFSPLRRVGRVSSAREVVVILVETPDGPEYLLVNLTPGTSRSVQLPNGRYVSFDGLALRVREQSLVLAGGTFAEGSGRLVSQASVTGTLTSSVRKRTDHGLGWFVTSDRLPNDLNVAGRTLMIQHGDGTSRSWTLDAIESRGRWYPAVRP